MKLTASESNFWSKLLLRRGFFFFLRKIFFGVALDARGSVWWWGGENLRTEGLGLTATPTRVRVENALQVSVGDDHCLVLLTTGKCRDFTIFQ